MAIDDVASTIVEAVELAGDADWRRDGA
jgi:hypothetical protein